MEGLFVLASFVLLVFLFLWFSEFKRNIDEEFSLDVKCSLYAPEWETYTKFEERRQEADYEQKIPLHIFQTNEEKVLPGMKEALDSWKEKNPEYRHIFFTTASCRDFIKDYFSPKGSKSIRHSCTWCLQGRSVPLLHFIYLWRSLCRLCNGLPFTSQGMASQRQIPCLCKG
ncbi:hypothetical protein GMAR_ORF63 [Golden Marseillevirus]|uniref:hypothetical protein n=1 Tax=Golden Marseillevirus TaxID=1720526 RepID=UPI000877AC44|nr:hypothetical protein GMAR_ORF63 [Golden Marseillevirus]ALX27438.1 hypothetical protein GMAR_ORF63 [Golden Marseillevirus]